MKRIHLYTNMTQTGLLQYMQQPLIFCWKQETRSKRQEIEIAVLLEASK